MASRLLGPLLATGLALTLAGPTAFASERTPRGTSPSLQPGLSLENRPVAAGWILPFTLRWAAGWAAGRTLDVILDRARLLRLCRLSLEEAEKFRSFSEILGSDKENLDDTARQLRVVVGLLEDNTIRDDVARARLRTMEDELESLAARIDQIDLRLMLVEALQKTQHRMLINAQGDILELEGQILDHQGQIINLDDRVSAIEAIVYPDPYRFLRHDLYISGDILYVTPRGGSSEGDLGAIFSVQYNLSARYGLSGSTLLFPTYAARASPQPDASPVDFHWLSVGVLAGPTLSVFGPHRYLSLQLGASAGMTWSQLAALDRAQSFWSSTESREFHSGIPSLATQLRADLGVAPPAFHSEAILSVGFLALLQDLRSSAHPVADLSSPRAWYVGMGIRVRRYWR